MFKARLNWKNPLAKWKALAGKAGENGDNVYIFGLFKRGRSPGLGAQRVWEPTVLSNVRLFADDCLLYRQIKSRDDQEILQKDLQNLETWASNWGMRFNAKKCYILSVSNKGINKFYELDSCILKEVDNDPYLGLTLSKDLKWDTHINLISKKASSTLGFIQRNLKKCP